MNLEKKLKKALGNSEVNKLPTVNLPSREEPDLVSASYTLKRKNKEKLTRLAKVSGYSKSTSEFLNDLIDNIEE